ncbi:hypothetical protein CB0940_02692 [Lecanosticta acicola]|uniref:C2H2-type domain-containing protein n=1 Tax=Lecanosticta acicola TaxID=111012 RepID=A0AAI9E753_9PEZI|nr:hypothetical protein CB0940_02692 [Lecanosticta acicola]
MALNNGNRGGVSLRPLSPDTDIEHTPYQELPFECTYPECPHRFETLKGMQRHKKYYADHYYCKRCDVDCDSWEELTAHKVDNMAPYVEGKIQPTPDNMPDHIVCEFCGEDFKSFGGRKIHRERMHEADQNVGCPGCGQTFIRAANMIEHIEEDHCSVIRRIDFIRSIHRKCIIKQIMKDPHIFRANLELNEMSHAQYESVLDHSGYEHKGHQEGRDMLLDQYDDEQEGGHKALQPEVDLIDMKDPYEVKQDWPGLPKQQESNMSQPSLSNAMSKMSLKSASASGSSKLYHRDSAAEDGHNSSQSSNKIAAWGGKSTSKALFPNAKPTPPQPGDYDAILQHHAQQAAANDATNALKVDFWDPQAEGYSAHRFYNALIQKYCCPFPDCTETTSRMPAEYDTHTDLEHHIVLAHTMRVLNCVNCSKRFRSVAGLVAHAESTKKCGIAQSKDFNRFLDDMTGGFLTSHEKHVPKIVRPPTTGTELVKAGERPGIHKIEYVGTRPGL